MSLLEGSTPVVDEELLSKTDGAITITVLPYSGEKGRQKGLRFIVAGVEISTSDQVYGICDALKDEKSIMNVAVYSQSGHVCVVIHYWQEVIESLATRIASHIGTSLGFESDATKVTIQRLQ